MVRAFPFCRDAVRCLVAYGSALLGAQKQTEGRPAAAASSQASTSKLPDAREGSPSPALETEGGERKALDRAAASPPQAEPSAAAGLAGQSDPAAALAAYEAALELAPSHFGALLGAGRACLALGLEQQGVALWMRVLAAAVTGARRGEGARAKSAAPSKVQSAGG